MIILTFLEGNPPLTETVQRIDKGPQCEYRIQNGKNEVLVRLGYVHSKVLWYIWA